MGVATLRGCYVTRTLEDCEKPWGVEWSVYRDGGRNRTEGPYKTEAEAKMKANAIRVTYQLLPLRNAAIDMAAGAE